MNDKVNDERRNDRTTCWRWHTLNASWFSFFIFSLLILLPIFRIIRLVQNFYSKGKNIHLAGNSVTTHSKPHFFSLLEYNLVEEQFKYIYCIACQHQQQTILVQSEEWCGYQTNWNEEKKNQSCRKKVVSLNE